MDITLRDVYIFLLVTLTAYSVLGLHCYHCASNMEKSECESDVEELKKGVFSKFAQNCSDMPAIINPVCAIEVRMVKEVVQSIIRSCSDGITFSFDRKLANLQAMWYLNPATNVTQCGLHQQLICVTLCNEDMCNGPEGAIVSFNSSSSRTTATQRMAFMIGVGITFHSIKP